MLELKEAYIKKLEEADITTADIRLFFSGKEMKDPQLMAEYGVKEELIIQVFKRKK